MRIFNVNLNKKQKAIVILTAIILLLAISSGTVFAYLKLTSAKVENSFTPATDVNPQISEDFNGNVKKDVSVSVGNTGYSVYVRAAIVVTWVGKSDSNDVYSTSPVKGTDYTITLNNTEWFLGADGFYYHKAPVNSGGSTADLIDVCQPVADRAPSGYVLNVRILSQTIQALGTTDVGNIPAVEDAWKVVTVDSNGNLKSIS